MIYEEFLSESGALRRPSPLRRFSRIGRETTTPLIDMSPGLPNTELFHLVGAKFQLKDGSTIELSKEDLSIAQNYGNADGIKPFIEWLRELTIRIHNPPTVNDKDPERALQVIVNPGALHGINSAADLVLSKGDKCLVQERSYASFLEALRILGADALPIKLQDDGFDMDHFREVLSQWNPDDKAKWATRPKMFYVVPNGNNPSGETISLEKRRQIYALAREYNFLILEDDAYYHMQYDEPRLPSFLSMDVDGRVIRCDSFSKTVGAGFRLGWVSGPKALITRMVYDIQVSTQHGNVLSQVLLNRMFRQWGIEGYLKNVNAVTEFYKQRRDVVVKAAEDYLTGLATWSVPRSGLFMWMKLLTIKDAEDFILNKVLKKGALFTPGGIFLVDQSQPSPYIRVAFSKEPADKLAKGMEILAEAIREESHAQENGQTE